MTSAYAPTLTRSRFGGYIYRGVWIARSGLESRPWRVQLHGEYGFRFFTTIFEAMREIDAHLP